MTTKNPHDDLRPFERVLVLKEVRDDIELLMLAELPQEKREAVGNGAIERVCRVQRATRTPQVDAQLNEIVRLDAQAASND